MDRLSFRTQLSATIDVTIQDWVKVKKQCMAHGNSRTVDEFSERLSHDFWNATPVNTSKGVTRQTEIGVFIEDESGLNHHLEDTDLYGEVSLTISSDLNSKCIERIS